MRQLSAFFQTAALIIIVSSAVFRTAAANPLVFTWNPANANPALAVAGSSVTADTIDVKTYLTSTIQADGTAPFHQILQITGFALNGQSVSAPGLNTSYGLYFDINGVTKFGGGPPSYSVLNISLMADPGNNDGTLSATIGSGLQFSNGTSGDVVLGSGSLVSASLQLDATGTRHAQYVETFATAGGEAAFFANVFPYLNIALTTPPANFAAIAQPGGTTIDLVNGGSGVVTVAPAPEPGSMALLGCGLVAVFFVRRRRNPLISAPHKNFAITLLACAFLAVQPSHADTVFNVRANLNDRIYMTGTVTINTTTGVVTAANMTALDDGGTVAILGTVAGQDIFAPGGLAPSYLVNITGSGFAAPYLFNLATPATSLVNYAGGPLCATTAASNCAFSDFYIGGIFQANAYRGFLAPASDAISNFNLTATFDNGDHMLGTVSIDTTRGLVLDENTSLYSGATLLTTFNNPSDDHPYLPTDGSDPAYQIQSRNSSAYLFNLGLATTSVVNYAGGNICGTSAVTNCDYSDFFVGTGLNPGGVVTSGSLSLPSVATAPEPSSSFLGACGLIGFLIAHRGNRKLGGARSRPALICRPN
jgi:hypothetical protein